MPKTDSSSQPDSSSEPLLTVHISRRTGGILLLALAVIAALIVVDVRSRQVQPAPALRAADVEAPKPIVPSTPVQEKRVVRNIPQPKAIDAVPKEPLPKAVFERESMTEESTEETSVSHDESQPVAQPPAVVVLASSPIPTTTGPITLNGAGATFPYPLYATWFNEFHKSDPDIQINYQAIGSGGGVRQLLAGTVDFGASDVPMTDEQLAQSRTRILHAPTVLDAVVPIYRIPGVSGEVRFTAEALAGIFLGKITTWNDAAIASANPDLNLPDQPIVVVHRSDGNPITFIFTDYLSKVSREWRDDVGKGTAVKWPVGLGQKGDEGVAGSVRQLEGAVGYVALRYAQENNLLFGRVRNSAGRFLKANFDNVTEAAAAVPEIPPDFRISITNAPGKGSYAIASFTWLLIPQDPKDPEKSRVMFAFLRWMINHGETMTRRMGYPPLPANVARELRQRIAQAR
jgi:phosphate transport system substrate-binding protein